MRRSRLRKTIWAAALTLIVAAALALAACGSDTAAPSSSSAAPSQAAASPSMASSATPLPDATVAGTFVFAKVNAGYGEVYVIRGDGTGLTRVASKSETSLDGPVWSPDGTRIAYCRSGKGNIHGDAYTVWAMNADGSGQRKLTTGAARGYDVAWAPDGTQVAFHNSSPQESQGGIFLVNADGRGLERVTNQQDGDLNWAPSAKIHFLRRGVDIYAVRPDGTGLTRETKEVDVSAFALSPDGKTFAIYDVLADRIVLLPADSDGAPVTVVDQVAAKGYVPQKFGVAYGVALTWSPDGKALAFATNSADGNSGSALYVVNADGSGLSVVPNTGMIWEPGWRPE